MQYRILHTEASMGWGGQELRIYREALGLKKRGHWVGLAASPRAQIFKYAKEAGLPVFPLPLEGRNLNAIGQLLRLIKKERISILNTHSSWDSWVGGIVKIIYPKFKLIRTRHLSTPIGKNPLSRLIYNILPDAVITTGEAIREKMIKHNRFNPDKIISIPTGVDLEKFNPKKVQPVLNKGSFLIGMISVLRSWKGHKYFISAVPEILERIPEARFYIVGDGPQKENIRRQIEEMGLENKIFMLGYRKDIPEILASLDVIVHPSTGHEGVPQTILQALAMQRPIVATNVGGIPEVIRHCETGLLIPPETPRAITEAVIMLYKNPQLVQKIASNGYKLVTKRYSLEAMLDRIEEVYNSLFS